MGTGGRSGFYSARQNQARAALEDLRVSYAQGDTSGFFRGVSSAPYFSASDLDIRVHRDVSGYHTIDLKIYEDLVLEEGDKVLIKTHWQKRRVNSRTGQVETSSGSAQFAFKTEEDLMSLVDIRGESPF